MANPSLLLKLQNQIKDMPEQSGVYSITLGDKVYVGESGNIKQRFKQHLTKLKHGNHSNAYMIKAFKEALTGELKVLEICDANQRREREAHWGFVFQAKLNQSPNWYVFDGKYCELPTLACCILPDQHPFSIIGLMIMTPEWIPPIEKLWAESLKKWREKGQYTVNVQGERIYRYYSPQYIDSYCYRSV